MILPAFAASLLRTSSRAYAAAVAARLQLEQPAGGAIALPTAFAHPIDDQEVRLLQLAVAVQFDRPALFEHSVRWYRIAFHHRGVPAAYLAQSLAAMQAVLAQELPPAAAGLVARHLQAASTALEQAPVDQPSALDVQAPHGRLAAQFLMAILEGRGDGAMALLRAALDGGATLGAVHDHVLAAVQREAGRMWLMGEIPIADEHYGSQIVDRALWLLHERLAAPSADAPRITTMGVGGNLHDLGIRMVAQRLQAAGFLVNHLGTNLPANDLEWAFTDRRIDLVALSATMSMHLPMLQATVEVVRRITGGKVPILVGGEPFRLVPDLVDLVGADAAAVDAAGAVAAAQALLRR